MQIKGIVSGESAMMALGATLAGHLSAGEHVFLTGPLGAGKTTLVRGFLRALGYHGTVNSPTYAMVETYDLAPYCCHHFDGYRIHDADEWLDMGIDDYVTSQAVCLIEWPESGQSVLPKPHVIIDIIVPVTGQAREVRIQCVNTPMTGWEELEACLV